jgi:hypothetical protein
MAIVVREADLDKDRQILILLLQQYLTKQSDNRRFDWLYRNSPHGPAQAWIAADSETDVIIGMASAFPRRFYFDGREEVGVVLGDFCIRDQYRSLGPALQLQRACLSSVDGTNKTFCFDFPSEGMMSVYKRLKLKPLGQMVRLAKPLRVDRKVKRLVKMTAVSKPLSAAGNIVLSLLDLCSKGKGTSAISLHQGVCGEEFTKLAQEIGSCQGVCVQRSAEYLNWRYLANPLHSYELLTARRGATLLAYAVFSRTDEDAFLVDLFGLKELPIISDLVSRLADLLRQRCVVTLSAPMLDSHPWIGVLQDLGFRKRETSPVVIYFPSRRPPMPGQAENFKWSLVHGDRDS